MDPGVDGNGAPLMRFSDTLQIWDLQGVFSKVTLRP